jgi:hypothetical protein
MTINCQGFSAVSLPAQRTSLNAGNMLDDSINTNIHRAIWAAVQVNNNTSTVSCSDGLTAFVYPNGSAPLTQAFSGVDSVRLLSTGAITLAEALTQALTSRRDKV